MSRIGKLPVTVPAGVTIDIKDSTVFVKGPKGGLSYTYLEGVLVHQEGDDILVSISDDQYKNLRGLTRTLIANMIEWVTNWYQKKLLVLWVWYAAKVQWQKIELKLWYSHPIDHPLPEWISADIEQDPKGETVIVISGIDKQLVWEQAAKIRSYRKPEPYKGKWVRYLGEFIQMKAGKTASAGE